MTELQTNMLAGSHTAGVHTEDNPSLGTQDACLLIKSNNIYPLTYNAASEKVQYIAPLKLIKSDMRGIFQAL